MRKISIFGRRVSFGLAAAVFAAGLSPAASAGELGQLAQDIRVPHAFEWTEIGVAVTAGPAGAWDYRLSGALSPATMVRMEDTYFLYYIGAEGDRETPPGDDGGPRHRALGVATSTDGIHFAKHGGNPVVTFAPSPNGINAQEEGVFSAVSYYDGRQITLYFGGMTMVNGREVRIDVYKATSEDGFDFTPPEKVLDTHDRSVWGNEGRNDEIFPTGVFKHGDRWNLYYLTKNRKPSLRNRLFNRGDDETWDYGMVLGENSGQLGSSRRVLLQEESALGGEYRQLSPVRIGADTYALFMVNHDPDKSTTDLELRTVTSRDPDEPTPPEVAYSFADPHHAIVFLDRQAGTWFMYYQEESGNQSPIRVMTAPALPAES